MRDFGVEIKTIRKMINVRAASCVLVYFVYDKVYRRGGGGGGYSIVSIARCVSFWIKKCVFNTARGWGGRKDGGMEGEREEGRPNDALRQTLACLHMYPSSLFVFTAAQWLTQSSRFRERLTMVDSKVEHKKNVRKKYAAT